MTVVLKPFWRYYGGKWRAAPRYPAPRYDFIIEPFAGAAGYSLRYYNRKIYLADTYDVIANLWRYLISVKPNEILKIPYVEHVDDLPSWVPQEARWLVGFSMNAAVVAPCRQLSAGRKKLRSMGHKSEGWSEQLRERVAFQVNYIRHWKVAQIDYSAIPNVEVTWFVDPPYNNKAGSYYTENSVDYRHLSRWCKERKGQTIVCENEGADWLPFKPFGSVKAGPISRVSHEAIWTNDAVVV